ncbi:MAG: hypothetical protein WAT70_15025, partial [Rhizobiaceae bacterium]
MIVALRIVSIIAAGLAVLAGLAVTASLFTAGHSAHGGTVLFISLAVTALYLLIAVLLFGIQRHTAGVAAALVPG